MQLRLDLEGDNEFGLRRQHIVENVTVIGRSDESDWQLDCGERLVSRRHAFLSREGEAFVVYDASANGVYLNQANEPLGEGQRAALNHGDRLHIGPFSIVVTLVDEEAKEQQAPNDKTPPAAAAVGQPRATPPQSPPPNDGPPLAPILESASDHRAAATSVTASRGLELGETRDAFQPPSATIPDDWDLEVGEESGDHDDADVTRLGRHLEALEPSVMQGLLEGLGESQDTQERRLTRQQAYALGASLREGLWAVLALRAELQRIEKELPSSPSRNLGTGGVSAQTDASIRRLIAADDQQALNELAAIRGAAENVTGRPTRIVAALQQAVTSVVRVFDPARFEERAERTARSATGRAAWLKTTWAQGMLKLAPHGRYWRSFRAWYAERGNSSEGVVQHLFEKSLKVLILEGRSRRQRQVQGRGKTG